MPNFLVCKHAHSSNYQLRCHLLSRSRDALQKNATATRRDILVRVPRPDGRIPDAEYPISISQLLASGSERHPSHDEANNSFGECEIFALYPTQWYPERTNWSLAKSKALLQEYGQNLSESSGSDADEEARAIRTYMTSRRARLKLARVIGITQSQINFSQMEL